MDVIDLLDKLDDLIYHSKPVRLNGGQAKVDREEAYALLDQIRVSLPEEIKQAEWIVNERREQREEPENGGLDAVVPSIEDLKHPPRPAPPPLTPAAAEKVCSIIEAAEQVRADAEGAARGIEEDARRRAREVSAEAEAKLRRADDVTRTLLREAAAASSEIDGLLERVRGPAAAIAEVLGERGAALEAELGRMRAAVDEARGEADSSPAVPEDVACPEGGDRTAEADPDVVFQPTEEWDPVEVMAGDESAEVKADPALPGPESYVHAERLDEAGEPVVEEPAPAGPEVDLLEPRPPRFGRWRRPEDASSS